MEFEFKIQNLMDNFNKLHSRERIRHDGCVIASTTVSNVCKIGKMYFENYPIFKEGNYEEMFAICLMMMFSDKPFSIYLFAKNNESFLIRYLVRLSHLINIFSLIDHDDEKIVKTYYLVKREYENFKNRLFEASENILMRSRYNRLFFPFVIMFKDDEKKIFDILNFIFPVDIITIILNYSQLTLFDDSKIIVERLIKK